MDSGEPSPGGVGGVETWDNDDVVIWAQRLGCYLDPSDAFLEACITGEQLVKMKIEDLARIGVHTTELNYVLLHIQRIKSGHRRFMPLSKLRKSHKLKKNNSFGLEAPGFTILHFNDAYELSPGLVEPVGGVSRLAHIVRLFQLADYHPFITFGGDGISPSLISLLFRGAHFPEVFNAIPVNAAVVGNHDLDYGPERFAVLSAQCKFPWIASNLTKKDGTPLDGTVPYVITEWQGKKIGLMGLIESDWLPSLTFSTWRQDWTYIDFIESAKRLVELFQSQEVDLIIALTHFRQDNDYVLARANLGIDMILGGHDHFYSSQIVAQTLVVKGGSDFRYITKIDVRFPENENKKPHIEFQKIPITSKFPEDATVKKILNSFVQETDKEMSKVICRFTDDIDTKASTVRFRESTFCNFLTDVIASELEIVDIVLLNGGNIRSDAIYAAGDFTMGDMMKILPFSSVHLPCRVTGQEIWDMIKVSISSLPKADGKLLHCSHGSSYTWDPSKPPAERLISVTIKGEPLDLTKEYQASVTSYMAQGGDGFQAIGKEKQLIPLDTCHNEKKYFLSFLSKLNQNIKFPESNTFGCYLMDHCLVDGAISPKLENRIKQL